jgi:hypothetical protein
MAAPDVCVSISQRAVSWIATRASQKDGDAAVFSLGGDAHARTMPVVPKNQIVPDRREIALRLHERGPALVPRSDLATGRRTARGRRTVAQEGQ